MEPIKKAVGRAISEKNMDILKPFVRAEDEAEIREAFDLAMHARMLEDESKSFADEYLLETVKRLNRKSKEDNTSPV